MCQYETLTYNKAPYRDKEQEYGFVNDNMLRDQSDTSNEQLVDEQTGHCNQEERCQMRDGGKRKRDLTTI